MGRRREFHGRSGAARYRCFSGEPAAFGRAPGNGHKGLQVTQQQAVDQLQIVQDQLVAQRAETKRLSDQIAALTERLDALQQSVANLPTPATHAAGPQPKSH